MKITPEVVSRVRQLEDRHGRLTPSVLVEDAKDPSSPLHQCFDWNLQEAAQKWWEMQARVLIRKVSLVITDERLTLRAPMYIRDPRAEPTTQGYISVAVLQKDEEQAKDALRNELRRVEGHVRRARTLASVLDLEALVDDVLERLISIRRRVDIEDAELVEEARPQA